MPVRISLCRNAGANRGKVVAAVVVKDDSSAFHDVLKIARNKLKIPKKKPVNLYEHIRGTQINEENWEQVVVNGTILNVACGEAFISPQGIVLTEDSSTELSDVPTPPRWPAPFGNSALDVKRNEAPRRIPKSPHAVVYVDLDGVLADFDRGIAELCGGRSPEQMSPTEMWQAIGDAEDFFGSLAWTEKGQDLFDAIQSMFGEDHIEILSAGQGKFGDQKKRWCQKHLGSIKVNICTSIREKPRWSRKGCILIDDRLDLKTPWENRGGRFVHHISLKETLTALQQLSDEKLPAVETTSNNLWPCKKVEYVALDVDPVDHEEILGNLPTELKKRIDKSGRVANLHVTLAHMNQVSQEEMRKVFGGLEGEKVDVEVRGLLWSKSIAALDVAIAEKSRRCKDIPRSLNRFAHMTIWHQASTKASEANDLPRQVQGGHARETRFGKPIRLVLTLTYMSDSTLPTRMNRRRSPFADLSGDVLNHFKRLSRTNRYIQLRRYDEHISVDYTDLAAFQTGDVSDVRLKECRGLLVSPIDGTVLARRFHKFYNVHEVLESDHGTGIDVRGCLLLEKLDGFLVSPFVSPVSGRVRWATRQEISPAAETFVARTPSCDFASFSKYWMDKRFTPLFECINRSQQKGVVTYDRDRMVLIAIRHMDTGLYVDWEEAAASAKQFNLPTARTISLPVGQAQTLEGILAFVRNNLSIKEEIEGVVMVLADGQSRYKIKTNWYLNNVKLHLKKPSRLKESSTVEPPLLTWGGLQCSHWTEIPNQLLWELALWKWLCDESINDDLLPDYVHRLNLATNCPIDILLYFIETTRVAVVQLDQDLAYWASNEIVQRNQGLALRQALSAGWETGLVQSYLTMSKDSTNGLRPLVSFLWSKIIQKSEWGALQRLLSIDFVRLSDLSTDVGLLFQTVFDNKNANKDQTTIILRGLPGSGKSHFARQVLAPYLAPSSVEIVSADDFFVTHRGYEFDESRLGAAHADCRERFMTSTASIRIVDNTNSTLQEYAFYKRKSQQPVLVFEIHRKPSINTNDHNVPQVVINRMKRRWENDSDAIHVQNFHRCY